MFHKNKKEEVWSWVGKAKKWIRVTKGNHQQRIRALGS